MDNSHNVATNTVPDRNYSNVESKRTASPSSEITINVIPSRLADYKLPVLSSGSAPFKYSIIAFVTRRHGKADRGNM